MNRSKTGPAKVYTDDEIARFAKFREHRAPFAPEQCNHGTPCWVAAGPPAIGPNSHCLGCDAMPRFNEIGTRRRLNKYPASF